MQNIININSYNKDTCLRVRLSRNEEQAKYKNVRQAK